MPMNPAQPMATDPSVPSQLYAFSIVFGLLPILVAGLRFQARHATRAAFGVDDWTILFALIACTVTAILILIGVADGGAGRLLDRDAQGKPIYDDAYVLFQKVVWAVGFTQVLAIGPTKISVLFFYRRIFKQSGKPFKVISMTLIVLASLWTIAFFIANILYSFPVHTAWARNPKERSGKMDNIMMFLSQSYADVGLDVLIICLPVPLIWRLNLNLKKRLLVSFIFLLGGLTTGASIARTAVQYGVAREYKTGNVDKTYYLSPILYWPMIEASIGIVAACLPLLGPLSTVYNMDKILLTPRNAITSIYLRLVQSVRSTSGSKLSGESAEGYEKEVRPSESEGWDDPYNLPPLDGSAPTRTRVAVQPPNESSRRLSLEGLQVQREYSVQSEAKPKEQV